MILEKDTWLMNLHQLIVKSTVILDTVTPSLIWQGVQTIFLKSKWLPSSSELSCEPMSSSSRAVSELLSALKWDVTGELFERAHIYVSFCFSVVRMCVGLCDFLWAFMGCLVQYICVCGKSECWKGKELVWFDHSPLYTDKHGLSHIQHARYSKNTLTLSLSLVDCFCPSPIPFLPE